MVKIALMALVIGAVVTGIMMWREGQKTILRDKLAWMQQELERRVTLRPAEGAVGVHLAGITPDAIAFLKRKGASHESSGVYVELFTYPAPKGNTRRHRLVLTSRNREEDLSVIEIVCNEAGTKLISTDAYERPAPAAEQQAALQIYRIIADIVS